jgi:ketosteroid isomerase-like protein
MSKAEIAAVNRRFEDASAKGDVETLAALYTSDAICLPPDGPFVRRP